MRRAMLLFLLSAMVVLSSCASQGDARIRIAVLLYSTEDIYVNTLRDEIVKAAHEHETDGGRSGSVILNLSDAAGSQAQQNDQIGVYIEHMFDVLCVNMVDRAAAAAIIDRAKSADIPIVFFNRQPVEEDMRRWEKAVYVGSNAEQAGQMQAELIAAAYWADPGYDRNGDGILQYVLLEGEPGHQDSALRTDQALKTLRELDIKTEQLDSYIANWRHSLAREKTQQWLQGQYRDSIELILTNNDEMAIGALEPLRSAGYNGGEDGARHDILLVGIDGILLAQDAVRTGRMQGTIYNDYVTQGKAIFELALSLATKGVPETGFEGFDGKYLLTEYSAITPETLEADASSSRP